MITDVRGLFHYIYDLWNALTPTLSIGLCIARGSMFLRCMGLMEGIDTPMVW